MGATRFCIFALAIPALLACDEGGDSAPAAACKPGYAVVGETCSDIDECALGSARCAATELCLNRPGTFECECMLGYERDAQGTCIDIDECQRDPCDRLVTCDNEPAGYACGACPERYWGTGRGASGCVAQAASAAVGAFHSCVLLADGSVKCWGSNAAGELGLGDTTARGGSQSDMGDALPFVPLGSGRRALALSAGSAHTCALLDDGSVKCWGSNDAGQLGLGDREARGDEADEMGDELPSVDLGPGSRVMALAAGGTHTCALLLAGEVRCWGDNLHGQLGRGDATDRGANPGELGAALPRIELGRGRTAQAIAAGGANTCALLDDGSLKCWGDNRYGQLGAGHKDDLGDQPNEMGDALLPIALGAGRRVTAVAIGSLGYVCALLDGGDVRCWGSNDFGQLGLGDTQARGDEPDEMGDRLPIVSLGSRRQATALALGGAHGCALLSDQSAKCWGINQYGTLGLEDFDERGDAPDEMGDALPALSLGTGRHAIEIRPSTGNHTCAVLEDGQVKCWGSSGLGQLGYGSFQARGGMPGEMGDNLPGVNMGHLQSKP